MKCSLVADVTRIVCRAMVYVTQYFLHKLLSVVSGNPIRLIILLGTLLVCLYTSAELEQ